MKKLSFILVLIFVLFKAYSNENAVFAKAEKQLSEYDKICLKAKIDAATYHTGKDRFFIFGFFTGPIAVFYAFNTNQDVDYKNIILTKNKHLLENKHYIECYKKEADSIIRKRTLRGWLTSSIVLLVLFLIYRKV